MIELRLTADSAHDLQQQMLALLAGATIAPGAAPPETGVKRGRGKAKEETVEPPTAPKGDDTPAETKPAEPQGELTKETFAPLVLALGQKAGPTAVTELFGEFGGATKFSQIPVEQYPALKVRLDELLA